MVEHSGVVSEEPSLVLGRKDQGAFIDHPRVRAPQAPIPIGFDWFRITKTSYTVRPRQKIGMGTSSGGKKPEVTKDLRVTTGCPLASAHMHYQRTTGEKCGKCKQAGQVGGQNRQRQGGGVANSLGASPKLLAQEMRNRKIPMKIQAANDQQTD